MLLDYILKITVEANDKELSPKIHVDLRTENRIPAKKRIPMNKELFPNQAWRDVITV